MLKQARNRQLQRSRQMSIRRGLFFRSCRARVPKKAEGSGRRSVAKTPPAPAQQPEKQADDFTTDTLAELYISQGFYEKAVDIYERMLVDNPNSQGLKQKLAHVRAMAAAAPAKEEASEDASFEIPSGLDSELDMPASPAASEHGAGLPLFRRSKRLRAATGTCLLPMQFLLLMTRYRQSRLPGTPCILRWVLSRESMCPRTLF